MWHGPMCVHTWHVPLQFAYAWIFLVLPHLYMYYVHAFCCERMVGDMTALHDAQIRAQYSCVTEIYVRTQTYTSTYSKMIVEQKKNVSTPFIVGFSLRWKDRWVEIIIISHMNYRNEYSKFIAVTQHSTLYSQYNSMEFVDMRTLDIPDCKHTVFQAPSDCSGISWNI